MVAQSAPHNGWIKVYRRLLRPDHPLHPHARNEEACYMAAWIDLVAQAQWQSSGPLKRGQLEASERFLKDRWNWKRSRVRHFLEKLEAGGMIHRKKNRGSRPSLITILNYNKYQSGPGPVPVPGTGQAPGAAPASHPPSTANKPGANRGMPASRPSKPPSKAPGPNPGTPTTTHTKGEEERPKNDDESGPESTGGDSGPLDSSGGGPETDQPSLPDEEPALSPLEAKVRKVEGHWLDWLSELELGADERRAFLGADQRERARSKFRARIRDDGMTVEDLQLVLDYVMREYWEDEDRLPWGGNLHPKSYLQNGDKARERLIRARRSASGTVRSGARDASVDHDELRRRRRQTLEEKIREARQTVASD